MLDGASTVDESMLTGESMLIEKRQGDALIGATINKNSFWALAYNVIGIPIAAAGFLVPWLAGAAMVLSSVSVILNAHRLQRTR